MKEKQKKEIEDIVRKKAVKSNGYVIVNGEKMYLFDPADALEIMQEIVKTQEREA